MSYPNDRGRPDGESGTASKMSDDDNPILGIDRRVYRRRHWAHVLIRRGREALGTINAEHLPAYGSDEWLALPDLHPARIAAVVVAAENWAQDGDELQARLRVEIEESRLAFKREEDRQYVARRDAHRKEWKHLSVVRSFPWNERRA